METYGMHSIHGRAPAVVAGLKLANPELDVWMITGDGDGFSIGGNHMIHALQVGKKTKSSPLGSLDHPINPLALAMGADATFVARSMDRDPKHLKEMLKRSYFHKGTALLEIYQNCNIFNDGAFFKT